MISTGIQIRRVIRHPYWDDSVCRSIVEFWERRGFRFSEKNGDTLAGRRGNILGNLASFDMSRLITRLTIRREGAVAIVCEMEIDTQCQIITPWNRRYWDLEIDTLESWLLFGDDRREAWEEYRRASRRQDFLWLLGASRGDDAAKSDPPS